MAICAVIDLTTNQQVNLIVAEVTDVPPENCKLVEFVPGCAWDSETSTFIEIPPAPEEA